MREVFPVLFRVTAPVYIFADDMYNEVNLSMDGANRVVTDCKNVRDEALGGIYRELATLVGVENTLKIYETYRGQQVTFPVTLYSRVYLAEQIVREYDGRNVKQLATTFGYSEKWIRKIVKENADAKTNG
ncbi:MAG: Mor transcription activator family protein [Acutalibacteraceae bacterium]